jgi:hypothetical protein
MRPPDFKTFAYNKSLECLAAPQQGTPLAGELIVVTEHSLDGAGNFRSFLIGSDRVTRFSVKRTDDFDVSECAVLPRPATYCCSSVALRRRAELPCAFGVCRSLAARWSMAVR